MQIKYFQAARLDELPPKATWSSPAFPIKLARSLLVGEGLFVLRRGFSLFLKSLFIFDRELFEKLVLDILELGLKSLSNFVLAGFIRFSYLLFTLTFCNFKVFFTAEFTFKHSLHNFFFLWLKSLVPKGSAKRHHTNSTIAVTDCGHAAHHWDWG